MLILEVSHNYCFKESRRSTSSLKLIVSLNQGFYGVKVLSDVVDCREQLWRGEECLPDLDRSGRTLTR